MSNEQFQSDLIELYQGELLGEVVFEQMLEIFTEPWQQAKLAALLQLETETKARLRPVLVQLGLPLTEQDNSRGRGREVAASLEGLDWNQAMGAISDTLRPAIARYEQIAARAPEEHRQLAESMLVHEQSLLEFVRLELAGEQEHSLDSITAQLQFKIPLN